MSFINIKKVTIENNGDVVKVYADVLLVLASLLHDAVEQEDTRDTLNQLQMLKLSIYNFDEVFKNELRRKQSEKKAEEVPEQETE